MTFYCNLLYDKIPGNVREVDPLNDVLRKVIINDYNFFGWEDFDDDIPYDDIPYVDIPYVKSGYWTIGFDDDEAGVLGDLIRFKRGDVLNIKTVMPYPKIYEFLKEDHIYHFCFLLKLDPLDSFFKI